VMHLLPFQRRMEGLSGVSMNKIGTQ